MITNYEDHCVMEVIDNGIGIAKSHLDKVAQMFYRGTDRSKGSGIGLYIVNEIVIKLDGKLFIDSELSLGTIVRLEIPNGAKGVLINRKKNLSGISGDQAA
jgi:signal transduction histidine kinase